MNRQKLQTLASEWVRVAKNDIRNKVIEFMQEVDATTREFAYALAISEGELEQILQGNGEITLSTFAKLLIATGNALEIKPIDETPLGDYDNIPSEGFMHMPMPRPNVFEQQRIVPPRFTRPTSTEQQPTQGHFRGCARHPQQPTQGHFQRDVVTNVGVPQHPQQPNLGHFSRMPMCPPFFEKPQEEMETQPQNRQASDIRGHFASRSTSPFARMTREEMETIIKERLWDSEIDIDNATNEQLVDFLEEKDKRMKAYKLNKEVEIDPAVAAFKNKLKNTVNSNPHLREWVKKLVGELDNE